MFSFEDLEEFKPPIEGLSIRYTELDDYKHLYRWLLQDDNSHGFPMEGEVEADDAARRWVSFARIRSTLTATLNGEPCGIITLYLQPYKHLLHQTEFGIIVAAEHHSKGIGSFLMKSGMHLAKEKFRIELLHLQVYEGNRAIEFYTRFGFRPYGKQTHWLKNDDGTYNGRIFMERFL